MYKTAITQTIEVGGKTLSIETGKLAKQADGSVVIRLGDTVILSTAVTMNEAREGQHFFPLTVDYRERFSAKGAFPGGFFKREGRPTDKETLTSRLIDRTIRPLFPDGFRNEVQVLNFVLSADEEIDGDVVAGVGSSAALALSGSPFDGPTAHVRVGRVDGEMVLYPTVSERAESDIDLIVAGKADAIVMVEGEMDEISEDDMVAALEFAHEGIKTIVAGINELVATYEKERGEIKPLEYETVAPEASLVEMVYGKIKDDVNEHLRKPYAKETFYDGIRDIKNELLVDLFGEGDDAVEEIEGGYSKGDVKE
ncbi:MAG: polyribonucleotide nucleotidyltransferase, partial [Planctomycetota bacterium]